MMPRIDERPACDHNPVPQMSEVKQRTIALVKAALEHGDSWTVTKESTNDSADDHPGDSVRYRGGQQC